MLWFFTIRFSCSIPVNIYVESTPQPGNNHHQDCEMFKGTYKNLSFVTATGWGGVGPKYTQIFESYTSKTTRKKYYELISLRFINFWTVIQKVVEAIKSWRFGCYLSFHPMFSFHPTIPPTHCTNIYVHTHLEKEAQLPEHPAFCGWMFGGHPLQQVILGRLTFLMLGYVSMGHWIFISSGIPLLILLQIRVTKVNSELPPVVTQCSVNCSASSGKGVTSAWKPRNAAYHIFICPAHMCCRT